MIELTVFLGLDAAEAGRELGLTAVAVRVRRHWALARLRRWLAEDTRAAAARRSRLGGAAGAPSGRGVRP